MPYLNPHHIHLLITVLNCHSSLAVQYMQFQIFVQYVQCMQCMSKLVEVSGNETQKESTKAKPIQEP